MNLAALLERLPRTSIDGLAFPPNLLGTFRRKSISFCTGATDETTIVYWLQSRPSASIYACPMPHRHR